MKAATTFKQALAVLEEATFRNGVAVTDLSYRDYPDEKTVVVTGRVVRERYGIADIRLVESAEKGKAFWLDTIHKMGGGGLTDLETLKQLVEDLINLAIEWETSK